MSELTDWLSVLYRADVLGDGNYVSAMKKFANHLARKKSLADEARARQGELARVVVSRGNSAYIEKKQSGYLEEALAAARRVDPKNNEEAPDVGAAA